MYHRSCFVVDVSDYAEQSLSRQSREVLTTSLQNMVPSFAELKNTSADQVIAHVGRIKRSMNNSMLNRNPILRALWSLKHWQQNNIVCVWIDLFRGSLALKLVWYFKTIFIHEYCSFFSYDWNSIIGYVIEDTTLLSIRRQITRFDQQWETCDSRKQKSFHVNRP